MLVLWVKKKYIDGVKGIVILGSVAFSLVVNWTLKYMGKVHKLLWKREFDTMKDEVFQDSGVDVWETKFV